MQRSHKVEAGVCPCLPCAARVHVHCRWPCCDLNFDPDRDLAWPLLIVRRGRTTLYSSSQAPGRETGAGKAWRDWLGQKVDTSAYKRQGSRTRKRKGVRQPRKYVLPLEAWN